MATVLHSSLTTTDLHEPKGVAAASSGQVYVADGAGSGAWTAQVTPAFMQKHIAGLTFQNAADTLNDITVLAGSARDTTNTEDMVLASSLTKRIDAAWAVGDNQGGLDTGAVGNFTYHLWLIKRTDTDVVDVLFSLSATAPTMPTNYTKKRRIGSFFRTGGSNVLFTYCTEIEGGGIRVGITPTSEAISYSNALTARTPSRMPGWGPMMLEFWVDNTVAQRILWATPGITAPGTAFFPQPASTAYLARVRTNSSGQPANIADVGSGSINIAVESWTDFRRD